MGQSLVGVLDVGLGNIGSVQRMIFKVGGRSVLISKPEELDNVKKIILPGVGHFDEGMRKLRESSLIDRLIVKIKHDKMPILGICLGMHLLCRGSEEGELPGLGLIDADVKKFQFDELSSLKIPHMGWNSVVKLKESRLFAEVSEEQRYYFVHSYKVVVDDPSIVSVEANYGGKFCAAFQQDNIYGVQFHPEKSHRFGMELIRSYVEL